MGVESGVPGRGAMRLLVRSGLPPALANIGVADLHEIAAATALRRGRVAAWSEPTPLAGAARFYLRGTEGQRNRATWPCQSHAIGTPGGALWWFVRHALRSRRTLVGLSWRSGSDAARSRWTSVPRFLGSSHINPCEGRNCDGRSIKRPSATACCRPPSTRNFGLAFRRSTRHLRQ